MKVVWLMCYLEGSTSPYAVAFSILLAKSLILLNWKQALISYPVNDEASVRCKTGKSEVPLSGLIHMYTHLQTQAVTRTPKQQVVI